MLYIYIYLTIAKVNDYFYIIPYFLTFFTISKTFCLHLFTYMLIINTLLNEKTRMPFAISNIPVNILQ